MPKCVPSEYHTLERSSHIILFRWFTMPDCGVNAKETCNGKFVKIHSTIDL